MGIVAYSPLARGLLSATLASREALAAGDRRALLPRFEEGNLAVNAAKAASLAALAAQVGCTPAQLSLAWLLAQGKDVFPIPGSKTVARVQENCSSWGLHLSPETLAKLQALDLAAAGNRYGEAGMKAVFETRM